MTLQGEDVGQRGSVVAVVIAILCVFLLMLSVLMMGNPISTFDGLGTSLVYAIIIYLPVFVVCALAAAKARRRASQPPRQ